MPQSIAEVCTLLERAQASQNIALARALAIHEAGSGASAREFPGALSYTLICDRLRWTLARNREY